MAQSIPPALQDDLRRFENLRQQHETLTTYKQTIQTELVELRATLEELRKQPDNVVTYKSVGQVMFRVDKPKIVEELDDREKTLQMKFESTNSQIEKLAKKLSDLEAKIKIEIAKHEPKL
ncbi:MAG: prefoldin subunit beta [Candidatus Thorarchaeota archaeon]|nr:prefoldin subunit beta [Candidatus Thorarchaeota archaeon]